MDIALVGFGSVGSLVYQNLIKIKDVNVKYVGVKNKKNIDGIPFTTNLKNITEDTSIKLIIECIDDNIVAKDLISDAIVSKINVITCNKPLMYNFGRSLARLATKNNVNMYLNSIIASNNEVEEDIFLTNLNFHNYSDDELYDFRSANIEKVVECIIKDLYFYIDCYRQNQYITI